MSESVRDTLTRMLRAVGARGVVEAAVYPLLTPLFESPWLGLVPCGPRASCLMAGGIVTRASIRRMR